MARLNTSKGLFAVSLIIGVVVYSVAFAAAAHDGAAPEVPGSAAHGRIAFTGDREGQKAPDEIYVMNADGTGEFRLTPTTHPTTHCIVPRWSPNGHQVAFHCFTPDNTMSDIFVINDDGTGLTQLTHFGTRIATFASWSPDGKQIAFGAGDSFLYIADVDSGTSTRLIVGARPDWSPDGRELAFQRSDRAIYVVELEDLEHPVRLTDPTSDVVDLNPRWSPNGRKITFQRGSPNRDGDRQIYVMNADGDDQVSLTPFPGNNASPSWSPNGRWIVFQRRMCDPSVLGQHSPNGSELFFIASDGSQEIQVTHGACQGPGGTFSADSTFSAFASWAPRHRH